jgi:succinate dehydrogenase / fumarate reductase cytochrome b subunit
MDDKRAIYRRTVFDVRSWQDFAVGHVAFALHRITGWLLLGWIGIHLIVPALRTSPSSVYIPTSTPVIVTLLTVLVFHAFNGVRLLLVELGGLAVRTNRLAFWLTTALSLLFVVVLGVGL